MHAFLPVCRYSAGYGGGETPKSLKRNSKAGAPLRHLTPVNEALMSLLRDDGGEQAGATANTNVVAHTNASIHARAETTLTTTSHSDARQPLLPTANVGTGASLPNYNTNGSPDAKAAYSRTYESSNDDYGS